MPGLQYFFRHNLVHVVVLCVLVPWTKVALALEGLVLQKKLFVSCNGPKENRVGRCVKN